MTDPRRMPPRAATPARPRHGTLTKVVTAGLSTSVSLALVGILADQAAGSSAKVGVAPTAPATTPTTVLDSAPAEDVADVDTPAMLQIRLEIPPVGGATAAPARRGSSATTSTRKRTTSTKKASTAKSTSTKAGTSTKTVTTTAPKATTTQS